MVDSRLGIWIASGPGSRPSAYGRATALDRGLGDPRDPGNPYGFAASAARDLAEEGGQEPDREGEREREVGDDQGEPGVAEPERADDQVEGGHGGDGRKGGAHDDAEHDQPAAGDGQAGQGVRAQRAEDGGQRGGGQGDAQAVDERPGQRALAEDRPVCRQGQRGRVPVARFQHHLGGRHGRQRLPRHRQRVDEQDGDREPILPPPHTRAPARSRARRSTSTPRPGSSRAT